MTAEDVEMLGDANGSSEGLREPLLGPFFIEGEEIIPLTTEATDAVVELALGRYAVRANVEAPRMLTVTPRRLTRFIQEDLDRVLIRERDAKKLPPTKGFLLMYQGAAAAIGRMIEEFVAVSVLRHVFRGGDAAREIVPVREARDRGWLTVPRRGVRSDDLVIRTAREHLWMIEVKGSLRGLGYLQQASTKALEQLQVMLRANPDVAAAGIVGIALREKVVHVFLEDRHALAQMSPMGFAQQWLPRR